MEADTHAEATNPRSRLLALRRHDPQVRMRDAAAQLGLSEAELVASFCGRGVTHLNGQWGRLLETLPTLGPVLALTRNAHAVIEKTGQFERVEIFGDGGQVLGEVIDLRLFLNRWRFGFAVGDDAEAGLRAGFQFFDETGTAVHKIFLTERSNRRAYDQVCEQFVDSGDRPLQVTGAAARPPALSDADVDAAGLRAAWRAMKDTHEFFGLLRRFKVGRVQALRLAGEDLARPVGRASLQTVLDTAVTQALPIMVFVGNAGAIQIHTGPVERVRRTGEWVNVLDPDFNLHVYEPSLAAAWVVRKPTIDGIVTAVELFDREEETIALLFGKRKPGQAESPAWRELVATL